MPIKNGFRSPSGKLPAANTRVEQPADLIGGIDLFQELRKFGKPVIINEFNAAEIYAPKHGKPYDDQKALVSLKRHIGYILTQTEAKIEGAEFYELYDEPWKDAAESNFGLMEDPKHAKVQMLLAAVYACGRLSAEEKATLVSRRLFTPQELALQLGSCRASDPS
jgi:hypothetical protein